MTGVTAVQYAGEAQTGGHYDESVVYDAAWLAPAKPVPAPVPAGPVDPVPGGVVRTADGHTSLRAALARPRHRRGRHRPRTHARRQSQRPLRASAARLHRHRELEHADASRDDLRDVHLTVTVASGAATAPLTARPPCCSTQRGRAVLALGHRATRLALRRSPYPGSAHTSGLPPCHQTSSTRSSRPSTGMAGLHTAGSQSRPGRTGCCGSPAGPALWLLEREPGCTRVLVWFLLHG